MAKKNNKKFLPKAGSTIAVALAMTVALSTQVSATELEENTPLPGGNPSVDENNLDANLNLNGTELAENNETVEKENEQTVTENQSIDQTNEQTGADNADAAEKNETTTEGELKAPELEVPEAPQTPVESDDAVAPELPDVPDVPAAPEMPNTEGMDAEDHNEAAGDYNEEAGDYNEDVDLNNEKIDDYNGEVDEYNDLADKYEDAVEDYNEAVGKYNDEVDEYNEAVGKYNDKVDAYNKAADAYEEAEQKRYEEEQKAYDKAEDMHEEAEDKLAEDLNKQAQDDAAFDDYQQEKEAYDQADSDYQEALEEYEEALQSGTANEESRAQYQQEKEAYDRAHADYMAALEKYNESLSELDPGSDEYQQYLQEKAAYDEACADYLAALENYNNVVLPQYEEDSAQYQQYLQDKAAYDEAYAAYLEQLYQYNNGELADYTDRLEQSETEKNIIADVNQYNDEVTAKNDQISKDNAELKDNVDVGVVESLKDVGTINEKVNVDEGTLGTLGNFAKLAEEQKVLKEAGEALADHSGKNAELGSDAYAAYLKAVEDHNDAVDAFNAKVAAYNEAVTKYNEAVDTFNATLTDSSSTSVDEAEDSKAADWGNYEDKNMSFNHLDVRYDAAVVKNQNEDGTYSDEVSKYDVSGVYYNEDAAKANPNNYGINYVNTDGQNVQYAMVKDDEHAEFGTASKNHLGEIDRTDAEANKNTVVTFYATLDDGGEELKDITVTLDKNSVYAANSYVKYDSGDFLHLYEDSEGNGLKLDQIDGEWYYDVSGKPVFLVSALVCDGYSPYGGFFNMGGLDLVLNLETMIEIHQADRAKKVGFMTYELEKYKAVDENNLSDPGSAPTAPTFEGNLSGTAGDPGKRPEAPTYDPGVFDMDEVEAAKTVVRLEHLKTLDKLEEKAVIQFSDPTKLDSIDTVELMDLIEIVDPEETPAPEYEPVVVDDAFEIGFDWEITIPEEEVPLAAAPKTGDISALWGILSGFSAAGMALLGRKRRDEE